MTKTLIAVPSSLNLPNALELAIRLADIAEAEEFVFDFKSVGLVEPFGMLLASSEIHRLRKRFPSASIDVINFERMKYAAHMGFFRAFGLKFGNAPGEANGSSTYLPLTLLSCQNLRTEAALQGVEVGDAIETKSTHLAAMLCGEGSGTVFQTLSYSIRELMRNVVEHSGAAQIGLCAQFWPSKSKVEVAIVDRGMGIRASLANNPHVDASDDKRALNYALMPAVSGKAYKGARLKQRGPWANSGFGLYMTNRICRNGGTFFIASGDTGMLLTKGEGKRYFPTNFRGTAIRMVLRTDQLINLRDALKTYREEGKAIQNKYKEIVRIDPSSASLMLSEDFDLSVWDRILAKMKDGRK